MNKRMISLITALSLSLSLTLAACGARPDSTGSEIEQAAPAYQDTTPEPTTESSGDESAAGDPNTPVSSDGQVGTAPADSGADGGSAPAQPGSTEAGPTDQSSPAAPGTGTGDSAGTAGSTEASGSAETSESTESGPTQAGGAEDAEPAAPRGPVQFATVERGSYSGFTSPTAVLITGQAQWDAVWKDAHAMQVPVPATPDFDFSAQSLVVVAMGERHTGGHSIEVTDVAVEGDRLIVTVRVRQPGPGDMVTMALTQPYHIVRLPFAAAGLTLEVKGMSGGAGNKGTVDR